MAYPAKGMISNRNWFGEKYRKSFSNCDSYVEEDKFIRYYSMSVENSYVLPTAL